MKRAVNPLDASPFLPPGVIIYCGQLMTTDAAKQKGARDLMEEQFHKKW